MCLPGVKNKTALLYMIHDSYPDNFIQVKFNF